jgi:hypothetical protein
MRDFKDVGLFLLSWMFLSDASSTATSMAVLIADAIGLSIIQQGAAAVVGLTAAGIGMTIFRFLVKQEFLTPFWALISNMAMLTVSICFVPFVTEAWQVYIIAGVAGLNVGSVASFTRSILSTMIPDGMQSNFFAVYELTQKGTSWIGPLVIGAVTSALKDDSDRTFVNVTVITIIAEVAIGAPIFFCVNVRRGQLRAVDYAASRDGRSIEAPITALTGNATAQQLTASPSAGLGSHTTKFEEGGGLGPSLEYHGVRSHHTASDVASQSDASFVTRGVELSGSSVSIQKNARGGSASNAPLTPRIAPQPISFALSAPGVSLVQPGISASGGAEDPSINAGQTTHHGPIMADNLSVRSLGSSVADGELPQHVSSASHFQNRTSSLARRGTGADAGQRSHTAEAALLNVPPASPGLSGRTAPSHSPAPPP